MINLLKGWRWTVGPAKATWTFWASTAYLFVSVFLITHLCACVFAFVALLEAHHGLPTWADADLLQSPRSCVDFYWSMFYFSSYTITSVGHGDVVPQSSLERSLDAMIMIFSTMYATKAISDLIILIATRNYWQAQRHRRVTQTLAALDSIGAPYALRDRVLAYQHFIWEVRTERRSEAILEDLSDVARFELCSLMYHELVHNCSCLQLLPAGALRCIVQELVDTYYLPSDFIIRLGDQSLDLYFMQEGAAGVFLSKKAPTWYDEEIRVLTRGDSFGEIGMMTGCTRTAWIMARTFCMCAQLYKPVLDMVIANDPGCMVLLAQSLQKALNLQAQTTWDKVEASLRRRYGSVKELFSFVSKQPCSASVESGRISLACYELLMNSISVASIDQKLLWIELDTDKNGSVSFLKFVRVAFCGTTAAESLREAEEATKCQPSMLQRSETGPLSLRPGPARTASPATSKSSKGSRAKRASAEQDVLHNLGSKIEAIAYRLQSQVEQKFSHLESRLHDIVESWSDSPSEDELPQQREHDASFESPQQREQDAPAGFQGCSGEQDAGDARPLFPN
jgi:hypothetical protein